VLLVPNTPTLLHSSTPLYEETACHK
jgi:ribonucleotide reductase alpha subunit